MSKNTAKKRAAGGIAKRVSGPLGSPVASAAPASPGSEGEHELAWSDVHSQWCLSCRDGADGDVVLYECSGCPRVMCGRCLAIPSDSRDLAGRPDVLFWCLSCHAGHTNKVPAPYFGFYTGGPPTAGGKPAFQDFLRLKGTFEMASSAVLAAAPVAVIHFIVGDSKEIVTPVPLLSHYLDHYFPNGGYIYLEVPFDIATHKGIRTYTCAQDARVSKLKSHLAHGGRVFAFFSDHSEEDSGWLFAGKEKGIFVAMSVSQVLCTVLGPYSGVLQGAMMVFLVCGSVVAHDDAFGELQQTVLDYNVGSVIIFSATRFQPLVAMNFLLALAEQVIVEQLDISKAFPGLLSLSSCLGQHTKVILMIREVAHSVHNLLVTQFARAHMQTQPWGIAVPGQCPLCGSTNSWSARVAVRGACGSRKPDDPDQAPVSRYLYACTYPECGRVQGKPPYKFHIEKPPGSLVNTAVTKTSSWFQSPSTTFPPSLMSLPASCGPSDTKGKRPRSMDAEVLTKRIWI
ncbi:uncharacterized protein EDB93DRAFT_1245953 [Suillus bovinus]|uniref:uncharacterized protein n=1 Tax=Suillus bovinus TaxID=48563 RepID=UPI001B880ABB|nr:uncharacterized protein EDB93DRAFT_1245953 [Suillus bovinus]KAG2158721.1 hypothetical protein EDB93DRAFT_1245953 [Suillus bovinus]